MSLPSIPNITPCISLSREETIDLLLSSIAMEEIGLSHILNAEGEKLQRFLEIDCLKLEDFIKVNTSVNNTLKTIIKSQMLLQSKLEETIYLDSLSRSRCDGCDCHDCMHHGECGDCCSGEKEGSMCHKCERDDNEESFVNDECHEEGVICDHEKDDCINDACPECGEDYVYQTKKQRVDNASQEYEEEHICAQCGGHRNIKNWHRHDESMICDQCGGYRVRKG